MELKIEQSGEAGGIMDGRQLEGRKVHGGNGATVQWCNYIYPKPFWLEPNLFGTAFI